MRTAAVPAHRGWVVLLVVYGAALGVGLIGVADTDDEDSWSTLTAVLMAAAALGGIGLGIAGRPMEAFAVAISLAAVLIAIGWVSPGSRDGWGDLWFLNVGLIAGIQGAIAFVGSAAAARLPRLGR